MPTETIRTTKRFRDIAAPTTVYGSGAVLGVFNSNGQADTASVSANDVNEYSRETKVEEDHGEGSHIADGVISAIKVRPNGLNRATAVGFGEKAVTNPVSVSTGDGEIAAEDLPITAIEDAQDTSATPVTADVRYTSTEGSTNMNPGSEEVVVNPDTGDVAVGSGLTEPVELTIISHDIAAAFNPLVETLEPEHVTFAALPLGSPLSNDNDIFADGSTRSDGNLTVSGPETYGIWKQLYELASAENVLVAGALSEGIAANDVELNDTLRALEAVDQRYTWLAGKAFDTGDLSTSYMSIRAGIHPAGSTSEQPAPTTVDFTGDGYLRSEYGDSIDPDQGTFHKIGANAVFLARDGRYRITFDRTVSEYPDTGTDPQVSDELFYSDIRIDRTVEVGLARTLQNSRRSSPTAWTFDGRGLQLIKVALEGKLIEYETDSPPIINDFFVDMPTLSEISDVDKLERLLQLVEVGIVRPNQFRVVDIDLEVGV